MVYGFRYIQIDETGRISSVCADPVFVDGVEITIDTEGMTVPEKPTDAIYDLYYNETDKLHWVKVGELEEETPTDEELAQAEMLLMQSEIIANQNAQDEVLAEILLNQIGG